MTVIVVVETCVMVYRKFSRFLRGFAVAPRMIRGLALLMIWTWVAQIMTLFLKKKHNITIHIWSNAKATIKYHPAILRWRKFNNSISCKFEIAIFFDRKLVAEKVSIKDLNGQLVSNLKQHAKHGFQLINLQRRGMGDN